MFSRSAFQAVFVVLQIALSSCGGEGPVKQNAAPEGTVRKEGVVTSPYLESGGVPDRLSLKFENIFVDDSGGGTDFVFLPGSNELLVILREGWILHLALKNGMSETISRFRFRETMDLEFACGPTNLLLDPQFEENRFIYTSYCPEKSSTRLMRYQWSQEQGLIQPVIIFEVMTDEPHDGWHRIGSMGFENESILWFFVGDHVHSKLAQDVRSPLGSLQRIIPSRDPVKGGHSYPRGNMLDFHRKSEVRVPHPGIYAYGFRSPWRATRDGLGRYWVGDVGSETYEEVNLLKTAGQNFGWDQLEGPCKSHCEGYSDPIAGYLRTGNHPYFEEDSRSSSSDLRAIWVGEIYESPIVDRYDGLMDQVVPFGDLFTGWVRGLKANEKGKLVMNEMMGHLPMVTSWRVGPDGYIYVLDLNGQLHVALLDRPEH